MHLLLKYSKIIPLPSVILERRFLVSLMILIIPLLGFLGILNHPTINDEAFYLPQVQAYSKEPFWAPIHQMNEVISSIGPVYYLILRIWTALVGSAYIPIRWFSLVCMTLAAYFWYQIGRKMGIRSPIRHQMAFLVMPYYLAVSICALSEPLMIVCQLAAVHAWLSGLERLHPKTGRPDINLFPAGVWFLLSGLYLAVAINARPSSLLLSPVLALSGYLQTRSRWAFIGPILAIVNQLPFWYIWGNIFPPAQRSGMMPQYESLSGLFPDTSIHILTSAGLFLWPCLSWKWKNKTDIFRIISGVFIWLFLGPDLSPDNPGQYRFAGPLLQIGYLGQLIRWSFILPFLAGWMLFCQSISELVFNRKLPIFRQTMLLLVVLTIIGLLRSPLAFDRYSTILLPFWYFAESEKIHANERKWNLNMMAWGLMALAMISRIYWPHL